MLNIRVGLRQNDAASCGSGSAIEGVDIGTRKNVKWRSVGLHEKNMKIKNEFWVVS
jgi:hypothetical protein